MQRIFLADVYNGKLGYGRDEPPSIATACLTFETDIFLIGRAVSIWGVPSQGLNMGDNPTPAKRARHEQGGNDGRPQGNGHPSRDGQYNTDGQRQKAIGCNPLGPPMFASSWEANDVLRKFPAVTLTLVAREAGFATVSDIQTDGLPVNSCMRWR